MVDRLRQEIKKHDQDVEFFYYFYLEAGKAKTSPAGRNFVPIGTNTILPSFSYH